MAQLTKKRTEIQRMLPLTYIQDNTLTVTASELHIHACTHTQVAKWHFTSFFPRNSAYYSGKDTEIKVLNWGFWLQFFPWLVFVTWWTFLNFLGLLILIYKIRMGYDVISKSLVHSKISSLPVFLLIIANPVWSILYALAGIFRTYPS